MIALTFYDTKTKKVVGANLLLVTTTTDSNSFNQLK